MTYKTPVILITAVITVWGLQRLNNPFPARVLSQETSVTPTIELTATPHPSPTSTPKPTPKPKPTKIPTPTPKPQPKFSSEEIYKMIDKYSTEKGLNPNVIRYMAICESGFNPLAKNHIYAGLFQYDAPTWKSYRKIMGENPGPDLRFNAQEAIRTTVYIVSLGRMYLWPNCVPK